ncbi:MAG: DMT family transporter [Gammaproteobacteria bacterium]|nr:DMT family transporter [Gammaproteobacteria bacterium]
MTRRTSGAELPALIALTCGALAIGSSGIFVRLSETGPTATAFWRGALAVPVLAVWAWLERRSQARRGPLPSLRDPRFFWAGFFFGGDLALWHWSLLLTSVAASTLEANCAPLLVTLLAWALWRERPAPAFLLAMALAFGGMVLIVLPKLGAGHHALLGDALGLGTACFYAGYLVVVARLRTVHGTGIVMLTSTVVFSVLLLPLALMQTLLPVSAHGWWLLLGCAGTAQVIGQGLIAYALAHLPATFGAVALLAQVMAAAGYAWWLLGERLSPLQVMGGAVVLAGILFARNAQRGTSQERASSQSRASAHSESR